MSCVAKQRFPLCNWKRKNQRQRCPHKDQDDVVTSKEAYPFSGQNGELFDPVGHHFISERQKPASRKNKARTKNYWILPWRFLIHLKGKDEQNLEAKMAMPSY